MKTDSLVGFEHIHQHSMWSLLDGYGTCEEYAARSQEINQQYLCITDHGQMGVIPNQIQVCEEYGMTPIFGCELYLNDMQEPCSSKADLEKFTANLSPEEKKKWRKSHHLLAIAYNNEGYRNLVALSTWSYAFGYGGVPRRPRVNHEILAKHKEGLLISSCCILSPVGFAFTTQGKEAAFGVIEKYMAMFGKNFYLEMMMLDFKDQKPYDAFIIEAHEKYHIPIILTQDVHYCTQSDSKNQMYMLMVKTGNTLKDIEEAKKNDDTDRFFELQDKNLWRKSEEELNQYYFSTDYKDIIPFEIFQQAKAETVKLCERAKNVSLDRSIKLPQIPDADLKFREELMKGFKWRGLSGDEYMYRLKEEYELICRKGFSSYFLIQSEIVQEARRVCPKFLGWGNGDEAVGPGRGSAVGSLACYCLGLTDVDPIKHDLLFSRFISEARGGKQLKLKFSNR